MVIINYQPSQISSFHIFSLLYVFILFWFFQYESEFHSGQAYGWIHISVQVLRGHRWGWILWSVSHVYEKYRQKLFVGP